MGIPTPNHSEPSTPAQLDELLQRWNEGDKAAAAQALSLIYTELKRLASGHARRERDDHTLRTTALVHEAYLKLAAQNEVSWQNREQLLGTASRVMREILVDYARRRKRRKRQAPPPAPDNATPIDLSHETLLDIHERLLELAKIDERKARLLEAHFFAGMTVDESAEYLGISHSTAVRDLKLAKAWLHERLRSSADGH